MFPVNLVLNQFDSISKVRSLWCQFYLFTAPVTRTAAMSQQMYAAAPEPKQWF